MPDPYGWLATAQDTIIRAGWQRRVRVTSSRVGSSICLDGREVLNFASNNYLGLAGDARLSAQAIAAIHTYGTGSTGSQLLSGHLALHQALETALVQWKGTQAALVFSSGYLANMGTISALVGARDVVFSDEFNHSSLRSGVALSQAALIAYPHSQMAALEQLLQEKRQHFRRALIVTDSVFSMDGDLAPLPEILALAQRYDCMMLVDEAHGTGVLGRHGAGAVAALALCDQPLIETGTLSKALGALGGYVCGSRVLIDFLRHRARTWVYSTGLTAADTAAALTAVQIIQQEPWLQAQLWDNITYLKQGLTALGLKLFPSDSAILCWDVGSLEAAVTIDLALTQAGIFAPAIRPPTVATSRIRFSVMATHERWMLDYLLETLAHLQL